MELSPTLIAASGKFAPRLLSSLDEAWRLALGEANAVLVTADSAHCGDWARALRVLNDVSKVARLEQQGHAVSRTVNAIWVADLHDPDLPNLLSGLETGLQGGLAEGRELRLHLLVLLPDLFPHLSEADVEQARRNIQRLSPGSEVTLPMRVWPLSVRNREDLYLHRLDPDLGYAGDLLPLLQHFIETCLFSSFPFHPDACSGLDWSAIGCCEMVIGRPSAANFAAEIWQVMRKVSLLRPASSAVADRFASKQNIDPEEVGDVAAVKPADDWEAWFQHLENLSSVPLDSLPEIPSCPPVPKLELDSLECPSCPEKRNCLEHPVWEVDNRWQTFSEKVKADCQQRLDSPLERLQCAFTGDLLSRALDMGFPAVEELHRRLGKKLRQANAELSVALEPFERLTGNVRLRSRSATSGAFGAGATSEDADPQLKRMADALDHCELDFFLNKDEAAQELQRRLADIRSQFEQNEKQWNDLVRDAETPPDKQPRKSLWRRIIAAFKRLFKGKSPSLPDPRNEEELDDGLARTDQRKRLCNKAWELLRTGHETYGEWWKLESVWLERWAELQVRRSYRDALRLALEKCEEVFNRAKEIKIERTRHETSGLRIELELPTSVTRDAAQRIAANLVASGLLRTLLSEGARSFITRITLEAERGIATLPTPSLEELLGEEAWMAAFRVAAPRVMVAHRPEQRHHSLVFSPGNPPRLPEPTLAGPPRQDACAVLFRVVSPIHPQDILADAAVSRFVAHGDNGEEKYRAMTRHAHQDRPNELLEGTFGV